jgi:hypothetical protein
MMKSKWFLRVAVILGVCMACLLITTPAMAMWSWCDLDPVLNIEGHTVKLDAGIWGDTVDPKSVNGKITFNITVPVGTQISVISCEPGANVKIRYDKFNINSGDEVVISVGIKTKIVYGMRLIITDLSNASPIEIENEEGTSDSALEYRLSLLGLDHLS